MISCVIPACNEEHVIVETLSQLKKGLAGVEHEIIVSDDGSTDRTAELAVQYARVVRYGGQVPKTIGAARNRGARVARFPILVFLDSDVRIDDMPRFFRSVIRSFEQNPALVAITALTRVYPETETWSDRLVLGFFNLYFSLANNVLGVGLTHGKCMIVRKEAFDRVGMFNESLVASEDAELFLRLSKTGKTVLDHSLTIYFSARRAHAIGWPRLLVRWTLNGVWVVLFKRAYSHDWNRARAK